MADEDEGSRLSLKAIIGCTAHSSAGFDCVDDDIAIITGSVVTLAHIDPELLISQRFFSARPTMYHASTGPFPVSQALERTTRSRRRHVSESKTGGYDTSFGGSPLGDTYAMDRNGARQRVKSITCLSISFDGKLLAVGEVSTDSPSRGIL